MEERPTKETGEKERVFVLRTERESRKGYVSRRRMWSLLTIAETKPKKKMTTKF